MEMLGGPRTMGRVYGWLLICDPPQQSLTELARTLSISKASVSTVARQLQEGGMIERLPSSTRQHLYRVTPGGFASVLDTQLSPHATWNRRRRISASHCWTTTAPTNASASKTSATSASSPHRTTATS